MNIGKELINILKTLTDSEVEYFDMILSSIPETEEFFEELTGVVEPLYKKYGFNEEYLGKMFLYYLGLQHGIEDGVKMSKECIDNEYQQGGVSEQ